MKCEYLTSFLRDYKKLRNKKAQAAIDRTTDQAESADAIAAVPHLKKLEGPDGYYRIRVGDYRLGLRIDGETLTFMRCGHRREFYRRFP